MTTSSQTQCSALTRTPYFPPRRWALPPPRRVGSGLLWQLYHPKPQGASAAFSCALAKSETFFKTSCRVAFNQARFCEHLATTWHLMRASSPLFSLLIGSSFARLNLTSPCLPALIFLFLNSTAADRCTEKPRGGRRPEAGGGTCLAWSRNHAAQSKQSHPSPVILMPVWVCVASVREQCTGFQRQLFCPGLKCSFSFTHTRANGFALRLRWGSLLFQTFRYLCPK